MPIKIIPIYDINEIQNPTIRDRARKCRRKNSTQYLAYLNNEESGYLSFEYRSDIDVGIIYEIYVLEEEKYRQKGIGNTLLELGEKLGREYKCSKLTLSPRPFDRTVTEEFLISWYKKHGYNWSFPANGEMEKTLFN